MSTKAEEIINPVFLLKYGYYDINNTLDKRMDSLFEYTNYFPEDIFNMDDLVTLVKNDAHFSNFNADSLDTQIITEPIYFSALMSILGTKSVFPHDIISQLFHCIWLNVLT